MLPKIIIINNVADVASERTRLQDELNYFSMLQVNAIKENNFDLINNANEGLKICRLKILKFRRMKNNFHEEMKKDIIFLN